MIEVLPERSKEYIERLRRNADRLYTLTSDILDATKIEAGTLRMNMTHFNLKLITYLHNQGTVVTIENSPRRSNFGQIEVSSICGLKFYCTDPC